MIGPFNDWVVLLLGCFVIGPFYHRFVKVVLRLGHFIVGLFCGWVTSSYGYFMNGPCFITGLFCEFGLFIIELFVVDSFFMVVICMNGSVHYWVNL